MFESSYPPADCTVKDTYHCFFIVKTFTSLTGKTASLALLTLSVRVKVVWPFGFEVVRLYLLSKDVKLLLPSSDEDTSVYKTKHKINHSDKHAFPEAYKAVFLDSILHGIAIVS